MGRGPLPCFPALDLGGNDPFSVLLLNHAWGEGDVRFAPLLCGESGPGGLFSWLVSYGAAAYSPAVAQASAARRRHPQFRRGPSLPRRLAGPASFNAGPVFPVWPRPKPFRAAAFLRLALFDGASPASASPISASPISAGSASVIRALSPAGRFREKVLQSASDIMSALLVEIAGKVPMGAAELNRYAFCV